MLLVNGEGLVGEVTIGGCCGHSDHEVFQFNIFSDTRKPTSKILILDMERADFKLLRELVSKVPWESAFQGVGIHQFW